MHVGNSTPGAASPGVVPTTLAAVSVDTASFLLKSVAALAPEIRADAAAIEEAGRLPDALLGHLAELGVFRLAAPRAAGGLEADPLTLYTLVHDLARADGSVG